MNIKDYIKSNRLYLDGSMGTMLQAKGLPTGELPESFNITHPNIVCEIHSEYLAAGSNVITANTFGASCLRYDEAELEKIISAALQNARTAKGKSTAPQEKWIALNIGPTGRMLKPFGDLDFEEAVSIFSKTVEFGAKYGADLVLIETMSDAYETKAALLAVKESCNLPVFVSNAYEKSCRLMTGADPDVMVALLEGMGADAIGVNCSFGPKTLSPVAEKYLALSSLPVILEPNAGLPHIENSKPVYDVSPAEFAEDVAVLISKGVSIAGGCCGTTPEYIGELTKKAESLEFIPNGNKTDCVITSYSRSLNLSKGSVNIGCRINPLTNPQLAAALKSNDINTIIDEAMLDCDMGADIIAVNAAFPRLDEAKLLSLAVCELQAVLSTPLMLCASDAGALESALRLYNGKPLVFLPDSTPVTLKGMLPLVKKYGGAVMACADCDSAIPKNTDSRLTAVKEILAAAEQYGIAKRNIVFKVQNPETALLIKSVSGCECISAAEC